MRGTLIIWLSAAVLYAAFHFWYGGWGAPLTAAEVDVYVQRAEQIEAYRGAPEMRARWRAFLAADDGREVFMVNVLRIRKTPEPVAGVPPGETPQQVLNRYSSAFLPDIASRAGWLVAGGRAAAPDIERWGVTPEADWEVFALVRYRSRRDLMEIVTDPKFKDIHPFKFAAVEATRAFPIAPAFLVFGPRLAVGLALLVLALLAQMFFVRRNRAT